jgi:cytoskeletal protein RodZ
MRRNLLVLAIIAVALSLFIATTGCNREQVEAEPPAELPDAAATEPEAEMPTGEEAVSEHPSEHPKADGTETDVPKSEHPSEHPKADATEADDPKPEHPSEHPG